MASGVTQKLCITLSCTSLTAPTAGWASAPHRVLYFWHAVGNKFLALLPNIVSNLNLPAMECRYRVFRHEMIQQIDIRK
jgi:hypothetical protein